MPMIGRSATPRGMVVMVAGVGGLIPVDDRLLDGGDGVVSLCDAVVVQHKVKLGLYFPPRGGLQLLSF